MISTRTKSTVSLLAFLFCAIQNSEANEFRASVNPLNERAEQLLKQSRQGDLSVVNELGNLYLVGATQDRSVIRLLEKASDNGSGAASMLLSSLYESGKGVKQDSKKAYSYLTKAGKQGDATAQLKISFYLFESKPELSRRWESSALKTVHRDLENMERERIESEKRSKLEAARAAELYRKEFTNGQF